MMDNTTLAQTTADSISAIRTFPKTDHIASEPFFGMTEGRPFSFLSSLKASADGDQRPLWVVTGHWGLRCSGKSFVETENLLGMAEAVTNEGASSQVLTR